MPRWSGVLFDLILCGLIGVGLVFCFKWTNWSQGANLHPDEYGLTNTLTQLKIPRNLSEYFNTRLSPISPYQKYDLAGNPAQNGPDNRMRWGQWPIILLRWFGETTGNTGYDEIRLMGRRVSAAANALVILLVFLIGRRLYGRRTGLVAAALSSLAVMQIQQSHFMTADNLSGLFSATSLYFAVRAMQTRPVVRPEGSPHYRLSWNALAWYVLFGIAFGMTMSSRINMLPLAGTIVVAALASAAYLRLRSQNDLRQIGLALMICLVVSGLAAILTFRVTQPMSFRALSGDTGFFTVRLNPDWMDSMEVARSESNGIGGGPPGEQWAHRPALVFPWVNMVVWGMGLPLGLAAWAGFFWAAWRLFHSEKEWRAHLLPVIWVGGFFLFMGTRWVKSIRYFLPLYPFLCLLAAWALAEGWRRARRARHSAWASLAVGAVSALVLGGALGWSVAFTNAVYRQDHTRVQAVRWIYQNIPGPFHLGLAGQAGQFYEPVSAPDGVTLTPYLPFSQPFHVAESGKLETLTLPHAAIISPYGESGTLSVRIAEDRAGSSVIDEAVVSVQPGEVNRPGQTAQGVFKGAHLEKGKEYYLLASSTGQQIAQVHRSVIANENWDEGLPFPFDGRDPFGGLYRGLTLEVRWYDDANKRQMFMDTLNQADYVIMPSQRAIWSTSRIPLTYPMTLDYYRALFNGQIGYDLAAHFQAPLKLGPLNISDVGGTLAWDKQPQLPLFNDNLFAAEEAFSVYDHPPVWIFKKQPGFNIDNLAGVLNSVDLSQVVIQSPREATRIRLK